MTDRRFFVRAIIRHTDFITAVSARDLVLKLVLTLMLYTESVFRLHGERGREDVSGSIGSTSIGGQKLRRGVLVIA